MTTMAQSGTDNSVRHARIEVLPVVRIVIYARLSQNRRGLSTATAIQVAECEAEARYYAKEHGVQIVIVDKFEEDDVSASRYSKRPRPLYEQALQLVRNNKVDMIWATEPERLVRRPCEMDQIIDLSEETALRYLYFTSDDSFDLSTPNGMYRARQAVAAAERESRKISRDDRGCHGVTINAAPLEEYIRRQVIEHLDDDNMARLLNDEGDGSSRLKELLAERRQKLAHQKSLEDERADGLLEKDEFYRMRNRVISAIELLDEQIREVRHRRIQLPVSAGQSIAEAYDNGPDGFRRLLLERVMKGLEIKPSVRKPRFIMPDGSSVVLDTERVVIDWRELSNADLYGVAALLNGLPYISPGAMDRFTWSTARCVANW